jgi:hypothetical protein
MAARAIWERIKRIPVALWTAEKNFLTMEKSLSIPAEFPRGLSRSSWEMKA